MRRRDREQKNCSKNHENREGKASMVRPEISRAMDPPLPDDAVSDGGAGDSGRPGRYHPPLLPGSCHPEFHREKHDGRNGPFCGGLHSGAAVPDPDERHFRLQSLRNGDVRRPGPEERGFSPPPGAVRLLLQPEQCRLSPREGDERHGPHRDPSFLEPDGRHLVRVLSCRRVCRDAPAPARAGLVRPASHPADCRLFRRVPEAADRAGTSDPGDQRETDRKLQRRDHRRYDSEDPGDRRQDGCAVLFGVRGNAPGCGHERPSSGPVSFHDLFFRLYSPGPGALAGRKADGAGSHGTGDAFRVHVLCPGHHGPGALGGQGDLGPHHRAGEH